MLHGTTKEFVEDICDNGFKMNKNDDNDRGYYGSGKNFSFFFSIALLFFFKKKPFIQLFQN